MNKAYLYDLRTQSIRDDIEFYQKKNLKEKNIFEVGVGTGRILLSLFQNGYRNLYGIELCEDYFYYGRKKSLEINFSWDEKIHQGDFLEFKTQMRFDVVLFSFNVFHEFLTDQDRILALQKAKSLLTSNGEIVLSLFPPNEEDFGKGDVEHSFFLKDKDKNWLCKIKSKRDHMKKISTSQVFYSHESIIIEDRYASSLLTLKELYCLYERTHLEIKEEKNDSLTLVHCLKKSIL